MLPLFLAAGLLLLSVLLTDGVVRLLGFAAAVAFVSGAVIRRAAGDIGYRFGTSLLAVAAFVAGLVWVLVANASPSPTEGAFWASLWPLFFLAGAFLPVLLAISISPRIALLQLLLLAGQLFGMVEYLSAMIVSDAWPPPILLMVLASHLLAFVPGTMLRRRSLVLDEVSQELARVREELEETRDALTDTVHARDAVEHELAVTRNQAEIADVAKTEFLATISHEIRTPLNGILPILEMLRETELKQEQYQHVDTALSSSRHLLRIINDILDFSKIEAGKLELESINLNLRDVIQAVTALMAKSAERKGLRISTIIQDDVPLFVSGDPIRLRQILINLVGNAIKFTNKGGVSVEVINQRAGRRIVDLLFVVRDTGMGMSPATARKLFQSFSQADASTTRKHGGSGLGLAICKRLVELMGGSIGVRSQQGVGSLFWFQVPFRRTLEINEHRTSLSNARVLVLSEDAARKRRLDGLLGRWGVMKAIAHSADEAVAKVTSSAHLGFSWAYEAVIIDIRALDGDVVGFIQELRRLTEMDDLKILLIGDRVQVQLPEDAESYVEILGGKCSDKDIKQALNHLLGVGQAAAEQTWWNDDVPEQMFFEEELLGLEQAPRLPVREQPVSGAEGRMGYQGRILVAEDNPVNLTVFLHLLNKFGLEVDAAADGAEAVKQIGSRSYDLVFMDCQMPGVDGYEATRIVRGREQEAGVEAGVPIIAMTANAMPGDRERCLQCGMNDYLSKPVDRNSLQRLLGKWLDERVVAPVAPVAAEVPEDESVIQSRDTAPTPSSDSVLDAEVIDELRDIMESEFGLLLRRYLDTAPEQLSKLGDMSLKARLDEVAKIAHSLKSSCANVGAMRMSDLVRRVEMAAKEKNQITCLELNRQLDQEARLVERALRKLLETEHEPS